ncbi:PilW family protein [Nitrosomonas sp. HPC101]|uniref:PilW family protein n=1 Tax=Nitrosomonas sp. HPC101 TaxID=1658667 RepID=UPI0013DDFD22|nr:PilW family protein [Nitrosomonas sp. HPC101]
MKSIQINHTFSRNQQGLTLVEMMVAMTIGLVLLGGMVTVLSSSQNTYRVNEALARMQENARYAFQLLSRDVRMAGYQGCMGDGIAVTNVLNNNTGFLWRFDQPLEGFEATNASIPSEVTSPLQGRDLIVARSVEGSYARVISHASASASLEIASESEPKSSKSDQDFAKELTNHFKDPKNVFLALVNNCQGAAVFQVTGIGSASDRITLEHKGELNSKEDLGRVFTGGEVMRVSARSYYIRTNSGGIPSLYWKKGESDAEELVEGIENMQIQYGEDTNEDRAADIYRTANQVTNWGNVVSVRIELLLQSVEDGIASQPQTYTFNGNTVTPADRRLRQAFSTVISLRNRAP